MARPINHAHLEISIWLIDCTTFGRKKIIIAIIINSLLLHDSTAWCHQKRGAGASFPPPISKLSPVQGGVSDSQSEARIRSHQPIRRQDSLRRVMVADVCNGHILLDVPFFCQPRLSSSPSFFTLLSNIVV